MKKVEYSQVVRRKLKALKLRLTAEFIAETAAKALKRTGLLSLKYLTRGKILCISCLVLVLYPRNPLIIGMNKS